MRALALTLGLLTAFASAQTPAPAPEQNPAQSTKDGFIFWILPHDTVDFLLQPVPQTDPLRLAQLKQAFKDFQCLNLREQPVLQSRNLLCTLRGTAPSTPLPGEAGSQKTAAALNGDVQTGTILFLAHYEHEGSGQSAVDNWSGAIMLPFLYYALSATPRHHTFLFAEVDGAPGSRALFDSFTTDERHAINGVIAVDALGLGPAQFYINPNDVFGTNLGWWWLPRELIQAASVQHFPAPISTIPGGWFKTDDTVPFRHHGIPSIVIQSIAGAAREIPGSSQDTATAINRDTYYNTFVLLAYYAAELDKPWPQAFNAASRPSRGRR